MITYPVSLMGDSNSGGDNPTGSPFHDMYMGCTFNGVIENIGSADPMDIAQYGGVQNTYWTGTGIHGQAISVHGQPPLMLRDPLNTTTIKTLVFRFRYVQGSYSGPGKIFNLKGYNNAGGSFDVSTNFGGKTSATLEVYDDTGTKRTVSFGHSLATGKVVNVVIETSDNLTRMLVGGDTFSSLVDVSVPYGRRFLGTWLALGSDTAYNSNANARFDYIYAWTRTLDSAELDYLNLVGSGIEV